MTATPIDLITIFAVVGVCALALLFIVFCLFMLGAIVEICCWCLWVCFWIIKLGMLATKFLGKRIIKLVRLLT